MHRPGGDDALTQHQRATIARVLAKRARAELRVSAAFARIVQDLVETGSDHVVIALAARAVADEVSHADLWLRAASHYAGARLPWPEGGDPDLPRYEGAEPWLLPALRVVGMSCINETIASVRLREGMALATAPVVRDAMHDILADEIQHSRLGWAYLASPRTGAEVKTAVSTWLVRLLRANLTALFEDVEATLPECFPEHGIPSADQTRRVVAVAVHEVVLPGFERVGLDVGAASAWARSELPAPEA